MIDSIIKGFDVWTNAQGVKSKGRVKNIDNISLEGIARLRELILNFAIRGKLVSQDENDEPSKLLIDKSLEEKNRRIEEGQIKNHKKLDAITNEMIPFELPNGWEWAWFADAYFFQEGPGIRNWQFRSEGIKLLNVQNIVNNKLILDNTDKYIDEDEYIEKYKHFTIQENDLLFASSGGSWGKSAFFTNPGYTVIVNTSTIRIHPYVNESSRIYLKSFLDSTFFKNQMIVQLVGMQPNFGSTHFLKILVPIPPANEQNRIAEKIAELMTLCDKLEEEQTKNLTTHHNLVKCLLETLTQANNVDELQSSWEKISQHFDTLFCTEDSIEQLKQCILQLAVNGRLVKQRKFNATSEELYSEFINSKENLIKEGIIKKSISIDDINNENTNWSIPASWITAELQNLFQFIDYRGKTPVKSDDGKRLITAKNIRMGYVANEPIEFVSLDYYKKWMTRGFPSIGDILIVTEGHTIGFVAINDLDFEFALAQRTICFHPFIQIDTTFFYYVFMSPQFQIILKDNQTGSAAEGIKASKLKRIEIPLPPLEEQLLIVTKVKNLFKLCDELLEKTIITQAIRNNLSETVIDTLDV